MLTIVSFGGLGAIFSGHGGRVRLELINASDIECSPSLGLAARVLSLADMVVVDV